VRNRIDYIERMLNKDRFIPVRVPVRKDIYAAVTKQENGGIVPLSEKEMKYVRDKNGNIQYIFLTTFEQASEFVSKFMERNW
jgi:hypothetical protein